MVILGGAGIAPVVFLSANLDRLGRARGMGLPFLGRSEENAPSGVGRSPYKTNGSVMDEQGDATMLPPTCLQLVSNLSNCRVVTMPKSGRITWSASDSIRRVRMNGLNA